LHSVVGGSQSDVVDDQDGTGVADERVFRQIEFFPRYSDRKIVSVVAVEVANG
jgi:hypothetical protein